VFISAMATNYFSDLDNPFCVEEKNDFRSKLTKKKGKKKKGTI
jgi:hypothetical protein